MTPEQALERVKSRLMVLPTSRIVNTMLWDAIQLEKALDVVDQVLAEVRLADVRKRVTAPYAPEVPGA